MISQVISAFSGKPVFGYNLSSPWYSYLPFNYIIAVHYMREGWDNLKSTQVLSFFLIQKPKFEQKSG